MCCGTWYDEQTDRAQEGAPLTIAKTDISKTCAPKNPKQLSRTVPPALAMVDTFHLYLITRVNETNVFESIMDRAYRSLSGGPVDDRH